MSILSPEQQEALAARTAMGRWGRPEELAGPALLLASEAGSYITGTVLVVDGGCLARILIWVRQGRLDGRRHQESDWWPVKKDKRRTRNMHLCPHPLSPIHSSTSH